MTQGQRKSYAIQRYMPQIKEHLGVCIQCRESVLGHMLAIQKKRKAKLAEKGVYD